MINHLSLKIVMTCSGCRRGQTAKLEMSSPKSPLTDDSEHRFVFNASELDGFPLPDARLPVVVSIIGIGPSSVEHRRR